MFDKKYLKKNVAKPYDFVFLKKVDSTNNYAKLNAPNFEGDFVVVSTYQTKGRGRKGRNFYSPKGKGIYLSIVLKDLKETNLNLITTYTAVKVLNAIENLFDVKLSIKWVNDLYLNGKKVCGILSEGVFGKQNYVVVGIGLNFKKIKFPKDLPLATSLGNECKLKHSKNKLIAEILNRLNDFKPDNYMAEYKRRSFIIGKEIEVLQDGTSYFAKATDIDDECRLIIDTGKEIKALNSGDVSVRGL